MDNEGRSVASIEDLYGIHGTDLATIRDLVVGVAGVDLSGYESDYIGASYRGIGPQGEKIEIRSNRLEDDEGSFFQWPEFDEYPIVMVVEVDIRPDLDTERILDDLRGRLGRLCDNLMHLHRYMLA